MIFKLYTSHTEIINKMKTYTFLTAIIFFSYCPIVTATQFPLAQSPRVKQDCLRYITFGIRTTYDHSLINYERYSPIENSRYFEIDSIYDKAPPSGFSGGPVLILQRQAPIEIQWSLEVIVLGVSIGFQLKHDFASLINPSLPLFLKDISLAWVARADLDANMGYSAPGGITGNLGLIAGSKLSDIFEFVTGFNINGNYYVWGNERNDFITTTNDTIDVNVDHKIKIVSIDPHFGIICSIGNFSLGAGISYKLPFYRNMNSNLSIYLDNKEINSSRYQELRTPEIINFHESFTVNANIIFEGKIKKISDNE